MNDTGLAGHRAWLVLLYIILSV